VLFQGNDYYASGKILKITWGTTVFNSLASWRSSAGQERVGSSDSGLTLNPQLVAAGGGGTLGDASLLSTLGAYKLQDGSPMIDAGLDLQALFGVATGSRDFYGTVLPQGSGYEVGAFERPVP
ncbi:MAG TPA: choice-of-anchor Q domain-containing protein, partial [Acidimicrobiales bacterium]|jgi:hypothetical protein